MPPLTSIIESFLIASSDGLESGKILELLRARASSLEEDGTLDASTQEEQDTLEEEISQLRALSLGDINQTIEELNLYYASSHRSFHIEDTAFGWKIFTNPDYAPYLEHLYPAPKAHRLSQAALETLAIIAYRQPITKASIEAVRGVSSDGMVQKLIDSELIKVSGRADLPGRPLLYSTTNFFLEHFGVKEISDLPNSVELRNMAWPTVESEELSDASQMQLGEFHQRQLESEKDEV